MTPEFTSREFIQQFSEALQLEVKIPPVGRGGSIAPGELVETVSFLNPWHASRIAVVTDREIAHLTERELKSSSLDSHLVDELQCLVICTAQPLPSIVERLCKKHEVSLLRSSLAGRDFIEQARQLLLRPLAERTTEHGIFVDIYNLGVFVTGKAGIGKSELALALVAAGHRLVSDDVTEFLHLAPGYLEGRCPDLLTDFMEVRGLGLLNVRQMFGAGSISLKKKLDLIIHLEHLTEDNRDSFDRLGDNTPHRSILGESFVKYLLPVAPGRNLAILVEAAVRNYLLTLHGYESSIDFIKRQQDHIAKGQEGG